jgi:hypothetical protein
MNSVSSFFDLRLCCDVKRTAIEIALTDAGEPIAPSLNVTLPVRPALAPFPANKRIGLGLRGKHRQVPRDCRQVS